MNTKAKMIVLLVVLVLAFAGLTKLTSHNVKTGSTCGCGIPAPSGQPPASKTPISGVKPVGKVTAGLPRLVDLGSTTCIPCKMMASVLDKLSADFKGKLSVEFINVSKNSNAAQLYKIRVIPTQVFIDANGKEFFRHEGYYPKEEILTKFKEHGIKLSSGVK